MTAFRTEVAVVGAGAAGLAAARRLRERNVDVLLIEARNRVGGRAYTVQTYEGSYPVELGAEFVHGLPQATFDLLRESGENAIGTGAESFVLRSGRIEAAGDDRWEAIEAVLSRVDIDGPDESIASFIGSLPPAQLGDDDRRAVLSMIEGFDAAIAGDASKIAIAKEWRSGVNDVSSRPARGYAPLMQHLARRISDVTLLCTPVERIAWSPRGAILGASRYGRDLTIEARRVVVTIPTGVLRERREMFSPPLPEPAHSAIEGIAMGPVLRVVLDFRTRFWETLDNGRFRDAGFFSAPDAPMRTLWTRAPQHTPLMVAWAGGGAAQSLIGAGRHPIECAIETAAMMFPTADIWAQLRGAYFHDWQADPYARGAYSYVRTGHPNARIELAKPVNDVIFFAGEATCDADAGTVGGALTSGYRAAELVANA
jgi:monoamine oxidase